MKTNEYHIPVLLQEVLDALQVTPGKRYIDATLGGGGHSIAIVERGGIVLSLDADQEAIDHFKRILGDKDIRILREKKDDKKNITISQYHTIALVKGNFKDIKEIAHLQGFEKVAGILFDLGVSSHQLDSAERGFSFGKEGPLDMRMDRDLGVQAKDLLHILSKKELAKLFFTFGEEPRGNEIAEKIVRVRETTPITTTKQLADIVLKIYGKNFERIHPATRVFQALRIAVNKELEDIESGLVQAENLLEKNGRLVVISFHSLEDRIVKQTFTQFAKEGKGNILTKKPIMAKEEEVQRNALSRSAKMRVFEKTI